MDLKKIIRGKKIGLIIAFLLGVIVFSILQNTLPIILPNQVKVLQFEIDEEDIVGHEGGCERETIDFSCRAQANAAFGLDLLDPQNMHDITINYHVNCQGGRKLGGSGADCICLVFSKWYGYR